MTCDGSGKVLKQKSQFNIANDYYTDCPGCAKCKPCTCPTCSLCGLGRMGDGPCGSMENHCLCKPCQECGGEGTIPSDNTSAFFFDGTMNPCPRCNGTGKEGE